MPASAFDTDYVAVGIMEDYDNSVRALATALGFTPPAGSMHINRADDPHRNGDPTADFPEWREPHQKAFALEYAVYEAGRSRMLEGLAKYQAANPPQL